MIIVAILFFILFLICCVLALFGMVVMEPIIYVPLLIGAVGMLLAKLAQPKKMTAEEAEEERIKTNLLKKRFTADRKRAQYKPKFTYKNFDYSKIYAELESMGFNPEITCEYHKACLGEGISDSNVENFKVRARKVAKNNPSFNFALEDDLYMKMYNAVTTARKKAS